MKTRRHHNNEGRAQIAAGRTQEQVRAIAKRLGIPYRVAFLMDCDGKLKEPVHPAVEWLDGIDAAPSPTAGPDDGQSYG